MGGGEQGQGRAGGVGADQVRQEEGAGQLGHRDGGSVSDRQCLLLKSALWQPALNHIQGGVQDQALTHRLQHRTEGCRVPKLQDGPSASNPCRGIRCSSQGGV